MKLSGQIAMIASLPCGKKQRVSACSKRKPQQHSLPCGQKQRVSACSKRKRQQHSLPCDQKQRVKLCNARNALANVQRKSRCTTQTLKVFLEEMSEYFHEEIPVAQLLRRNDSAAERRKFKNCGSFCLKLNGCVGCNEKVFHPQDKAKRCPQCGHPRYNRSGRPNEVTHTCLIMFLHLLIFFINTGTYRYVGTSPSRSSCV